MSDQTTPLVQGFSVADLASPETIRDRAITWAGAVSAEEAGANFRAAAQRLRDLDGPTPDEVRQAADGVRALGRHIAEEADRA